MLLGLIQACDLIKAVFGKENKKENKKKIKDLLENKDLSSNINSAIKEINEEIMAALTVIMIAATTASIASS